MHFITYFDVEHVHTNSNSFKKFYIRRHDQFIFQIGPHNLVCIYTKDEQDIRLPFEALLMSLIPYLIDFIPWNTLLRSFEFEKNKYIFVV